MAAPQYGDFAAVVGTSVQRLGYGYPEPTVNEFHGLINASNITGTRNRGQEQTINRGQFARKGKPGKWQNIVSFSYHLDIERLMKLFAAMPGAVAQANLTPSLAWRQTITPSVSVADTRFHTLHMNRNGRVYTMYNGEPLSWSMNNGDEFWDCQMEVGCTEVAHCQAFPVVTVVSTYTGLIYAFGQYLFGDDAATSYDINIIGGGISGAALVRTRETGDVGWAANQTLVEGQPIYVRDDANIDSGMFVVFKRGGPAFTVVNFANGAGDTFTVTVGGVPTVLTEGVDFSRGASDAACGAAMANAINANATLKASVVAYYKLHPGSVDRVVVIPKVSTTTVTLATGDATAWNPTETTAQGNTWAVGDNWTLSSRGDVVSSSVPDHTVFSPNSFEVVELTYDGVVFEIEPNSMSFAYQRGLKRDEYRIGSPYVKGHPRTTIDSITGSFRARSTGARYLQDSNSAEDRALVIALQGVLIPGTLNRERFRISIPYLNVDSGLNESINQEYVNYHDVKWTGRASSDVASDAVEFQVDTPEEFLTE